MVSTTKKYIHTKNESDSITYDNVTIVILLTEYNIDNTVIEIQLWLYNNNNATQW